MLSANATNAPARKKFVPLFPAMMMRAQAAPSPEPSAAPPPSPLPPPPPMLPPPPAAAAASFASAARPRLAASISMIKRAAAEPPRREEEIERSDNDDFEDEPPLDLTVPAAASSTATATARKRALSQSADVDDNFSEQGKQKKSKASAEPTTAQIRAWMAGFLPTNTPLQQVSNERRSFHASNGLYLTTTSGNRIEAASTVPVALHALVKVASAPGSLVSTFWCHLKTADGRRVSLNHAGELIALEAAAGAAGDSDSDVFYWFQLLRSRTLSATLEQCSLRAHTGKFLSVKQKSSTRTRVDTRSGRVTSGVSKITPTEKFEVGNVDASATRLLGESSANAPLSVQHTLVMRPPPPARAAAHADKLQPPPPPRPPPAAFATCAQSERVAREFEAAFEQLQEAALSAAKAMEPDSSDVDGAPRPILLKKKDLAAVSRLSMLSFSSLLSRAVAAERAQGKARAGVQLPLGAWSPGDVARVIMGPARAAAAATARTWRVADALLRDSECDELEADMNAFEAALRAVAADVVAVPVAVVPLTVSVAAGRGRVVDKEAAGRTKAASALPARVETGATGSADRENEAQSAARGEKIRAAARLDFAVVCDFAALSVGVMELFR